MAGAEHELVLGAGVDRGFGLFPGQGQGFFAKNVLPGGDGARDLAGVKRMRRGEDDGFHAGMLEGFGVAGVVLKAVGFGKFLPGRIGLGGTDDVDVVLCLL